MQFTNLFLAVILPTALALTLPRKVPRNDVVIHAEHSRAVETAGQWDTDDDDAVAYAWYEEEGDKQN
ncbi:hypothetical protein F5Y11DRAFT_177256 [Daldinia sp. FL1419]|nr:hypothetical protein F5Y11DRAFT_177256 [Daldinia sp. FL1419]